MGYEEKYQSQEYGRVRITTDQKAVTLKNVKQILLDAYNTHLVNRQRIKMLVEFERGNQPLQREKTIRSEIDIKVVDNIASEIINYKTGYKWGNPISYKQRGNNDIQKNDSEKDNEAIAMINEMLNEENSFQEDTELAYYVETCGVGYQIVDIRSEVEGNSLFRIKTLNPMNTFVVYDNTIYHSPVMGVTYVHDDLGNIHFTCLTADRRYEILNFSKVEGEGDQTETQMSFAERNGEANPMKRVNIVEFIRTNDRMGAFEREISAINALNILESDFCNNVAQDTQSLWWGDNLELPEKKDETGKVVGHMIPRSGGWILTSSGEQKKASVQPLVVSTPYDGILNNVRYQRDIIKQRCFVPGTASTSGGSTGSAMSMASGWESMEVQAQKEESFIREAKMKIAGLILTAVKESPFTPDGNPILKLSLSDIEPNILRDRNYDMATKANTLATLLNCGIDPKDAISVIKLFSDVNLVLSDSEEYLDLYYESKRAAITRAQSGERSGDSEVQTDKDGTVKIGRTTQDSSDQASNSPLIGGMKTTTGGSNGKR